MAWNLLLVGMGGAIGACARYWIGIMAVRAMGDVFPLGTLIVNLIGCLLIGVFMARLPAGEPQHGVKLFFVVGLLGGMTTFSAFGYETLVLFQKDKHLVALLTIASNVVLGLACVSMGWRVGRAIG